VYKIKGVTAAPGLLLFGLVIVVTLSVFYFITMIPILDEIVAIKAESQIYLQIDDRGGAFTSFLQTRTADKNYAQIIGELAAKGYPAGADSDIEKTLDKIDKAIEVYNDTDMIKSYGDPSFFRVSADIALPGLKKGEVRAP